MTRLQACWRNPAVWALVLALTPVARAAQPGFSAATGDQLFHSRSLGSPYTSGIPYALWLAMMERYPEQLGANWEQCRERFGLLANPSRPDGLPMGFVFQDTKLTATRFLMTNCALCHTGEINGQVIDGLGSRALRINALNTTVMRIAHRQDFNVREMLPRAASAAARNKVPWGWRSRLVTGKAIEKLKELSASYVEIDAGPGRNGVLEFTKAILKQPVERPYGFVRFRPLWTYKKRSSFGADGTMTGDLAMALAAVEFNKGMPAKYIVKHRNQWSSLYEYLNTLPPPRYPGKIDSELARTGEQIFVSACGRCHGTYSGAQKGGYRERIIPLSVIGTDPDRHDAVTPGVIRALNRTSLGEHVTLARTAGYVPPPLDGIWCRGPYLHNGSVPSLADLLLPAGQRPISFFVGGNTAYDMERLGIVYSEQGSPDGLRRGLRSSATQIEFNTQDPGNSNRGHEFANTLSAEERSALLEYLKQL
jgi:hypothetical protein